MDTKEFIYSQNQPLFHPELYERSTDLPGDKRTLLTITDERSKRLPSTKVEELKSPGKYNLTPDDKQISGSNTRFLFKNLYGETPLTFLFFSDKNIKNIQNLIKLNVHKQINYIIDDQSNNELMIIMRSIFLEYSLHPALISEEMSETERQILFKKYTNEVDRLNKIVVQEIVPKIVSQIQQYVDYLRDASQQPYYMDKPKNESVKGQKQYRSVTQVLSGGNF
jgi:hypothetical protein|uniref:Minor capsid protein P8 central region domain-containing protein n=1 Tax=viral metagenome TaxID=1070528 RepID=A0A6C0AMN3_9ZZZZ